MWWSIDIALGLASSIHCVSSLNLFGGMSMSSSNGGGSDGGLSFITLITGVVFSSIYVRHSVVLLSSLLESHPESYASAFAMLMSGTISCGLWPSSVMVLM